MADLKMLHDEDFLAWSEQQADALRTAARTRSNQLLENQLLDWENLAEEIEGLGISQRSTLGSQIRRVIHHLLKLEYSSTSRPRRGWEDSAADTRTEIEDLLERSPSLAREIGREIARQTKHSVKLAVRDLERRREIDPATTAQMRAVAYSEEQVLGDWFPPKRRETAPDRRPVQP